MSIVVKSMVLSRYGLNGSEETANVQDLLANWGRYVGPARSPDTPGEWKTSRGVVDRAYAARDVGTRSIVVLSSRSNLSGG